MPLSAGLFKSEHKNPVPQCPPRLHVQFLTHVLWSRVPNHFLKVDISRISERQGWSVQCLEPLQFMSLHIPEENRYSLFAFINQGGILWWHSCNYKSYFRSFMFLYFINFGMYPVVPLHWPRIFDLAKTYISRSGREVIFADLQHHCITRILMLSQSIPQTLLTRYGVQEVMGGVISENCLPPCSAVESLRWIKVSSINGQT